MIHYSFLFLTLVYRLDLINKRYKKSFGCIHKTLTLVHLHTLSHPLSTMTITVTSYPLLFLIFVIFGVMLLYQFHSNCEILKQNFQVDNFINGFTLEEEQGTLIGFIL